MAASLFLGAVLSFLAAPAAALKGSPALHSFVDKAISESIAYDRLAELTDTFGARLTGSPSLERAIDWAVSTMKREATFDSVITEEVKAAHWVRGEEYLIMNAPRPMNISMLGLGMSIGTGGKEVTAEVLVVKDFEELERRSEEARGKIVVYNAPYVSYSETGVFRRTGAVEAEKHGAVASLVRSVGPFSLYSPHTGNMVTAGIPSAAITIEDSELLQRFQDRGERVQLTLFMSAHFLPDTISRNVVADYKGWEFPDEVVVMGGHIDSWDVGTGAQDDGGGVVIAWEAVRLFKQLSMRPRRTIRVVLWTNEENGAKGGETYFKNREGEMDRHIMAMESDKGVFWGTGIGFSGSEEAHEILLEIGQTYLGGIGAGNVTFGQGEARDIELLCAVSVPCASVFVSEMARADKTDVYFNYHHTEADTMSAVRRNEINSNVAGIGVWAYAVANLPERLPR